MKKIYVFILLIGIFISCKEEKKTEVTVVKNFELPPIQTLFKSYYEGKLKLVPLQATQAGDYRYNDQLPIDISAEHINKARSFYRTYKDSLSLYGDALLSEEEKLSKQVLYWEINMAINSFSYNQELFPANQMFSLPLTMGQLGSGKGAQPFNTPIDYTNWLKRLRQFSIWCEVAESNMKKGIELGYVLPKPLIKKMIPQLERLSTENIQKNLFYIPVLNFPKSFTKTQKDSLRLLYKSILKDTIIPSLDQFKNFVKSEYYEAGRETSGISHLPNGRQYYNYLIKLYTTTNLDAETIHQIGLNEVERIGNEMLKIKNQVKFDGTLKEFFQHIRNKRELKPFKSPSEVIANFNAIHKRMQPHLNKLFDITPKTSFEIRRTEAFREASASAQYNPGSLDGTRPGIFYVPIPDVKNYNTVSDEDLFLHEAIPGHHYQISLQQENKDLPDFRKTLWYSAYGEGWALYTESLGKDLGLYTDPYQYFGMLSAEMHRAIRLVVDTGIHVKGWSREDAIKYSLENEAASEASIIAEVERYMAIPGQALSYKIGQLKIMELRQMAKKELAEQFDIKDFHNKILESGCIPLNLLEQKIMFWIQSKKSETIS